MVALIGTNDEHSSRELLRSQIETVEDLEVRIEVADRLLEYKFLTTENGARYSSTTWLAYWPKNRTLA
jgi:CRISPR/Cas system-associated endonuclease Cas1